jgi:hypothetical protein
MVKRLRKLGGWGWKLLMFGFNMFQGLINTGVTLLGNLLSPLLTALGIRGLFKTGGKGFLKTAKEGITKGAKGAKGFAGKTAKVQRMAGGKAAGKFAAKGAAKGALGLAGRVGMGVLKTGGRLAGGAAGIVTGVGFGLWDAFQAIRAGESPEGFVGGWLARGISGFLGGTDKGKSGAISGALKGGGLGAAIGTAIFPAIGTALGGAIGALAGGILGFIGGENISRAINAIVKPIKKIVKGVWAVITFPWKMLKESVKFVWLFFTKTKAGKKIVDIAKSAAKKAWNVITMPYRIMFIAMKKLGSIISEKWDAFKGSGFGKGVIKAWDMMTTPFTEAWAMIGQIGTAISSMWTSTIAWINKVIKKIKDIPLIGKFMKGLEEIHEGTFAENLIQDINNPQGSKPKEILKTTDAGQSEAATIAVKKEMSSRDAARERFKNMTGELSDKMKETSEQSNKVAIGNTSIITTNMNNTTNSSSNSSGGGNGGASGWWGSGAGAAADVTYSNMN